MQRHMLVRLTNIKYKERIYKTERKKAISNIQGKPHMINSRPVRRNCQPEGMAGYI